MKTILTLVAVLFVSGLATAKQTANEMITAGPKPGGHFPHFTPTGGSDAINNKVSLRLIGRAYYKHNGSSFVVNDSSAFTYSNGRGGVPDIDNPATNESIFFDECHLYTYHSANNAFQPLRHTSQTFDADNRILSLTYASWKKTTNSWKDSARYLYAYNQGKMVASSLDIWYGNMWTNTQISTMDYSGNNVTKMTSNLYEVSFNYDALGNLTVMEDRELTSTGWQNSERHSYTYVGKDITRHVLEVWDNGSWVKSKQWEYTYTGPDVETAIEYKWNGSWVPENKHLYTYDGSHNKLTDILQVFSGSFQNTTRETWTYNGQNLPVTIVTNKWDGTSWMASGDDFMYNFYYENYFPVSVSNTVAMVEEDVLNVYPTVADDRINVDLSLTEPQEFSITILNANGAIVRQWTEAASRNFKQSMSVSELPVGHYFMQVAGQNKDLNARFIVAH